MDSNEPALNLTYDELPAETKEVLKILSETSCPPLDAFDRGCRSGVINFWFQLA
ncbi:TPA: hypothetical protein ACODJW_004297 [Salmonella enterica subsp. enterica serovar Muenchen]